MVNRLFTAIVVITLVILLLGIILLTADYLAGLGPWAILLMGLGGYIIWRASTKEER